MLRLYSFNNLLGLVRNKKGRSTLGAVTANITSSEGLPYSNLVPLDGSSCGRSQLTTGINNGKISESKCERYDKAHNVSILRTRKTSLQRLSTTTTPRGLFKDVTYL